MHVLQHCQGPADKQHSLGASTLSGYMHPGHVTHHQALCRFVYSPSQTVLPNLKSKFILAMNPGLRFLQGLVSSAAVSSGLSGWGVVLSVLTLLVSAVLGEWLWTRLRFDMHKIPMAPNSVPVLGE